MKYLFWGLWAIPVSLECLFFMIPWLYAYPLREVDWMAVFLVILLIGASFTTYVLILEFLFAKWREGRSPHRLPLITGVCMAALPLLFLGVKLLF